MPQNSNRSNKLSNLQIRLDYSLKKIFVGKIHFNCSYPDVTTITNYSFMKNNCKTSTFSQVLELLKN